MKLLYIYFLNYICDEKKCFNEIGIFLHDIHNPFRGREIHFVFIAPRDYNKIAHGIARCAFSGRISKSCDSLFSNWLLDLVPADLINVI